MRSQQAAPTLCTDEPGVQARYAQQFYRDLEEVFPLVDEGVEPRLHGLIELKGGCFLGDVCKAQLAAKTSPLPGHPACTVNLPRPPDAFRLLGFLHASAQDRSG